MRIAIDARELRGAPTGVGRYLGEILAAWTTIPAASAHDYILCAPGAIDLPAIIQGSMLIAQGPDDGPGARDLSGVNQGPMADYAPDKRASELRLSMMTAPGSGTLWEQRVLPRLAREARADVLLAPGYTGPLWSSVPLVLAIHDVSFAAHPEWFSWREGARRRTVTRMAAARAARILTISEFSKREIAAHLGVESKKIEVIYPGVTRLPGGPALRARRSSQDGLESGPPTVLFVGSIFNRRHIPELIEGFARLARTHDDVRLEIVGDNRTTPHVDLAPIASASGVGDRIRLRSYVPDEELGSLYAGARAFAFLSDYEGFGLTPLEALAAGIPIVVLETPVAREICGEAAIYVQRPGPVEIETALRQVLFDDEERARQAAATMPLLARYSWQSCAEQVLAQLEVCGARPIGANRT